MCKKQQLASDQEQEACVVVAGVGTKIDSSELQVMSAFSEIDDEEMALLEAAIQKASLEKSVIDDQEEKKKRRGRRGEKKTRRDRKEADQGHDC